MGAVGLIRSPDGRVWKLDRLRPRLREAETFKVPYFWPSVVATVALLAGIAWLVSRDPGPTAYLFLIPLVVWLVERGFNAFRPFIKAETEGPPQETLMWRPGSRWGYGRVERRIARRPRPAGLRPTSRAAPLVRSG